jgi:hypothetical protein
MGIERHRSMQSIYLALNGTDRLMTGDGTVIDAQPKSAEIRQASFLEDSNNPSFLIGTEAGEQLNIGSAFDLMKIEHDWPIAGRTAGTENVGLVRRYDGPVVANLGFAQTSAPTYSSLGSSIYLDVDSPGVRVGLGATAISRCSPASPHASFAVFLGEIVRDGVPSLLAEFNIKSQLEHFRAQGRNYLNVEFGWKPFINDLRKVATALNRQADILEDLRKNSGKAMRRRYEFPVHSEVATAEMGVNYLPWPGLTVYHWKQDGCLLTAVNTKRTWFSGEFRYYYPPVNAGLIERIRHYSRSILGVDVSPGTLWDLTPWTWLADWFGNVGDVLANISSISEDNLAMRYGYLMQEAVQEFETRHYGVKTWYGDLPSTITGMRRISHKTRIGASPYGFGTTWDGFSPRQVAILVAIGINQGRGRSM